MILLLKHPQIRITIVNSSSCHTWCFLSFLCIVCSRHSLCIVCIYLWFPAERMTLKKNVNVTSHWPSLCGRSSGLYIGMIDCRIGFWVIEMIFFLFKVNIKTEEMTHFAVGALNTLCSQMMPCTVICGSRGHTEDVHNNSLMLSNWWGWFLWIWHGNIFTSAKALHFVIKTALHWKGTCIYAHDAFGMPFILRFNKATVCPFFSQNVQDPFHVHIMFPWARTEVFRQYCREGRLLSEGRGQSVVQQNGALLIGALCI